jgi:hypothetical protein
MTVVRQAGMTRVRLSGPNQAPAVRLPGQMWAHLKEVQPPKPKAKSK